MKKWRIWRARKMLSPGYPDYTFEWYASYNHGDKWCIGPTFEMVCKWIKEHS